MIKSKTKRIVNARTGQEEIIYIDNVSVNRLKEPSCVQVTLGIGYKLPDTTQPQRINVQGKDEIVLITIPGKVTFFDKVIGGFKKSTFDTLFAGLTEANEDQHLLDQVVFINAFQWPVGTPEEHKVKVYDFVKEDLEIVVPEAPAKVENPS